MVQLKFYLMTQSVIIENLECVQVSLSLSLVDVEEADADLINQFVFTLCTTVASAHDASLTQCGLCHHFLPAVYSHNFLQDPVTPPRTILKQQCH